MPLYKASIVKDISDDRPSVIHSAEINFFTNNAENAESVITAYVLYAMPGMTIDSVYEMACTVSDPMIAESDKKES